MSKLLLEKKKTGILISVAIFLTVAVVGNFTINKTPDFPCSQDPELVVSIENEKVPLAKVDTTSKTTKKTSTKKIKLKSASKKSYTKNLPTKTKTSTKTATKTVSEEKVVTETQTIVKTTTKEVYKKSSKIKTVTQIVATTVNTTTTKTPLESAASESSPADTTAGEASNGNTAVSSASDTAANESSSDTAVENSTGDSAVSNSTSTTTSDSSSDATAGSSTSSTVAGASADDAYSVSALAPKTDSRVKSAFEKLGFEIAVNSSVSYAGKYDTRAQLITLKRADDTVYHELGHFLAFIAGNMDTSSSFKAIYEAEKTKYTGFNKSYVTQNSSEYFAESFKDYTLDPSALKKERPDTYDKIEAALELITDSRISKYKSIYAPYWK